MDDNNSFPNQTASKRETLLRVLVLGTMYALAVFFVIAFSPSMGVVAPQPAGDAGSVAAVEPARR